MTESSTYNKYKEEENEKEMCQCRSCGSVFHQSEIVKDKGQRKCPNQNCNSTSIGIMIFPYNEEYNTYKYPSFYYRSK
jgi:predicted Zn-ribbon and HTH transcriptional regulator